MAAAAFVACALLPRPAVAQEALDMQVGAWATPGPDPSLYTAALRGPLVGPVDVAARAFGLVDTGPSGRSLYGLGPEITVPLSQGPISPYLVAGTGLALETGGSTGVAAVWNAGAGLELRPLAWLGIHAEGRRFVEDREAGGFWGLQPEDRRGWQLSAGISVTWGGGARRPADPGPGAARPPGDVRVGADATSVRAGVVETALEAMGEPYRWGGDSSDGGFDCSGLVWYAYAAHGIDVPRVSRRQARAGRRVSPELSTLREGDILLFGDAPGRVTHVGLYVGDARFIHSTTSGGVTVSSLDPNAGAYEDWWARRWVGARRVVAR
jgi:hypothetical protein